MLSRAYIVRTALMFLIAVSGCQCDDDEAPNNTIVVCTDCDEDPCESAPCDDDRTCVAAGETYSCTCTAPAVEVGGLCVTGPCAAEGCEGRPNTECVALQDQATCRCLPGHSEDAEGACVADTSCTETTCSMHGMCSEDGGALSCTCEVGWGGEFCAACDIAAGYVSDGNGGCTDDPCAAMNCADEEVCVEANDGSALCVCAAGTHEEDGRCVPDTTCGPNSCNGQGQCDDATGVIVCSCGAGWAGQFCGMCDDTAGYHDDGMGGCTMDPCLPNLCMDPNKTTCTPNGPQFVCSCDTGYHDEGGACVADEVCAQDSCTGHGTCDDSTNVIVCTCDPGYVGSACAQCDANAGYRPDGAGGCTTAPCTPTALPDDGFDCTIDTCPNGLAVHTRDDSACDDALWCTGVEVCAPADPNADARGCVSPNPPLAPASPSPCQTYGGCDEQAQSFPLLDRAVGAACSDGIYCTRNDACTAAGACVGALQAGCPNTGTCTATTPLGAIDITEAHLNVTVTYDGQDPVAQMMYGSFSIWAVDRQQNTWTRVASYYGYGTNDTLSLGERLLPGVYDLVYTNTSYSGATAYTRYDLTDNSPETVYGLRVLQQDVVIGAGINDLVIDVPVADITPTVTYAGQDPAAAMLYGAFSIWALDRQNDTWTRVASYYGYGTNDTLSLGQRLLPGTYDLIYTNTSYTGDNAYTRYDLTDNSPATVYGLRVLQQNVVISDTGPNNLVIDVPEAAINPTVTYNGQDPVAQMMYGSFSIWAVDRTNATWTRVASYYGYGTNDTLSLGQRMLPGTYDLVYTNTSYTGTTAYSRYDLTDNSPATVYGLRVLQENVVITPNGANNLVIDVPEADINPTVTYDGQDPVAQMMYGSFSIWAVDRTHDTWTRVASYYGYGTNDTLSVGERMLPGTYDLVYTNTSYTGDNAYRLYDLTDASPETVYGLQVLQENVVISDSGANNLVIDVPVADISPTVTYNGQDPVARMLYGSFSIWAIDRTNDTWTRVASYYGYGTNDTLSLGQRLLPGTYDLVYTNTSYTGANAYTIYDLTDNSPATVYGMTVLQQDVVIGAAGANALVIDVPETAIAPQVTYEGVDPAVAQLYGSFSIWAVERATATWVRMASYYGYGTNDTLSLGERMLPGTYDLLYTNTSYTGDAAYSRYDLTDNSPATVYGLQVLAQCVLIP